MTTITIAKPATGTQSHAIPSLVAILLGGFFIFVIGFSHIGAVHNAAHDTRHSNGFPCH